jgi:hypothetical protein
LESHEKSCTSLYPKFNKLGSKVKRSAVPLGVKRLTQLLGAHNFLRNWRMRIGTRESDI